MTVLAVAILLSFILLSAVCAEAHGINAETETEAPSETGETLTEEADDGSEEAPEASKKADEGYSKYFDWIYKGKDEHSPDVKVGAAILAVISGLVGAWLFGLGFKFAFIEGDWDLSKRPWVEMTVGLLLIGISAAVFIITYV